MDFAVPADYRVKIKESKKRDKYLDLARELKKLWNMKVTMILIVVGALGIIPKRLVKGLEDLEIRVLIVTNLFVPNNHFIFELAYNITIVSSLCFDLLTSKDENWYPKAINKCTR